MPIRTLIWNIDNFDINKIANPAASGTEPGTTITPSVAAANRLSYILDTFEINRTAGMISPHIIAVIEVSSNLGVDARGSLAVATAWNASSTLLGEIRTRFGAHWALIPPLQISRRNSIALFYDTRTLVFSGPFIWPSGSAGVAMRPGLGVTAGDYPPDQQSGFVDLTRRVPAGALGNVGQLESQLAAATEFTYKVGHANAGNPVDLLGAQLPSPYLVTFAEVSGAVVQRNLSLFIVHGPGSDPKAELLLQTMANMQEIGGPFGNKEVRVVCGDFNLNLMDDALVRSAGYTSFIGQAKPDGLTYELALNPLDPAPVAPPEELNGYKGYYATHTRSLRRAAYFGTGSLGEATYPGYWYVGNTDKPFGNYALDNFLTVYGPGTARPASNITILNGVVGSPFNVEDPPFGGGPKGTLSRAIAMAAPAFQNPQRVNPRNPKDNQMGFQEWNNFGRIISTSDHMAVVIDI
jgi:hypothetical protein